jgi:hypothetical protein
MVLFVFFTVCLFLLYTIIVSNLITEEFQIILKIHSNLQFTFRTFYYCIYLIFLATH